MTDEALIVDLSETQQMLFSLDPATDIAVVHLGEPRAALMDEVEPNLYARLSDNDEEHIIGVETLAFRRRVLKEPFLASAWEPAREEIERCTGHTPDEDFELTVTQADLPKTHAFLLLLLGWTAAKHDSLWNPTQPDEWPELIYERNPAETASR